MEVYVYYRVAVKDMAAALCSIEDAQTALSREWPALACRVLLKTTLTAPELEMRVPTAASDDVTFMEIYSTTDASLKPQTAATLLAHLADLPVGRASDRRVECFELARHFGTW